MATYTTSAKVLSHLPASPPATVTDYTTADIADASNMVEAMVGPSFAFNYKTAAQKFPDVTDAVPTPAIIEMAARWLAVSMQYTRLKENVRENEESNADRYRRLAEDLLIKIRDGEIMVEVSAASIRTSLLTTVEDTIYADTGEAIHNLDDIDELQY